MSEDMQEPKYRVEDLTQEQYDYLRGLVGWLGTLCDELTGSTCAHEGRPPTPDEVQAAQRRARHLSDEHRECWRQRYEDVLARYTELYDAYRFFCKQPPPTREDVLQSLGMEPEPDK